jgi:hypothetical protein
MPKSNPLAAGEWKFFTRENREQELDSNFRWNDELKIPAFAGMASERRKVPARPQASECSAPKRRQAH